MPAPGTIDAVASGKIAGLSARQQREREYYEEFARRRAPERVDFRPVQPTASRPWNAYWFVYEQVRNLYARGARRMLDFGCGSGVPGTRFAYIGYETYGFDVCPENVGIARRLASDNGLAERARFVVGTAEELDYPDEHFDVVVGLDVLHHVEIPRAIREVHRVLRPGGTALFREPIRVPVFDVLRDTWLARRLVPKTRSFERHITDDERKLTAGDVATIRRWFPEIEEHRFAFLSRFNRFLKHLPRYSQGGVERLDQRLFRRFPALRAQGGCVVLVLRKG